MILTLFWQIYNVKDNVQDLRDELSTMHLFMKQKFSAEKWRNKIVTVGSDEVGILATSLSTKIKV